MSETFQLILGFIFLIAFFLLTQWLLVLKMRSTCNAIVKELENLRALNPETAVTLPYDRSRPFKIGGRDYKSKALESLVQSHIVIKTDGAKYYLTNW